MTKPTEKMREGVPRREVGKREINQIDKQRASLSQKNRLHWGDYVVRELGTERQIFMKPSESERSKSLVFIITEWFSPPPPRMGCGIEMWRLCRKIIFFCAPWKCSLPPYKEFLREIAQRPLKEPFSQYHCLPHSVWDLAVALAISHATSRPAG